MKIQLHIVISPKIDQAEDPVNPKTWVAACGARFPWGDDNDEGIWLPDQFEPSKNETLCFGCAERKPLLVLADTEL